MSFLPLGVPFNPSDASINGYTPSQRWLSQLSESFVDPQAYQDCIQQGDTLVYQVTNIETAAGEGQLHYGLARLMPGRVGDEYYLTYGHIHAWLDAAEVYICLSGTGMMLLENVQTGECHAVELNPQQVVYVPGYTAHRTVNTGSTPLIYWGVLSSQAGHNYQYVQENNFQQIVIQRQGQPVVMRRDGYSKVK